jgi:hypothetical protein
MYYCATLIGEYLNFHMPRATQITLEIKAVVAERQGGGSPGITESCQQIGDLCGPPSCHGRRHPRLP